MLSVRPTSKNPKHLDVKEKEPARRSPGNRPLNKSRRFSVTFTDEAYGILEDLATKKGKSLTATIQDAVTLEKWAVEAIEHGARIVLRMPDGQEREVLLR